MSVASTDEAAFKEINVKNGVSIVHQVVMCGFARFSPVRHSGSVIGGGRSLKAFNQSSQSAELRRLTIGTDAQRISAAVPRCQWPLGCSAAAADAQRVVDSRRRQRSGSAADRPIKKTSSPPTSFNFGDSSDRPLFGGSRPRAKVEVPLFGQKLRLCLTHSVSSWLWLYLPVSVCFVFVCLYLYMYVYCPYLSLSSSVSVSVCLSLSC